MRQKCLQPEVTAYNWVFRSPCFVLHLGGCSLSVAGLLANAFAASAVPPFGLPDGVILHTRLRGASHGFIGTLAEPRLAEQPTHAYRLLCHNLLNY